MRLREFTQDYTRNQSAALMTILQRLKSQSDDPVKVPLKDVIASMAKAGYDFDHAKLVDLYNTVPGIKNMIGSPDENELTIGKPATPKGEKEPEDVVGGMASKAADAAINK